mmetsp:Transcript_14786/g.30486  ORF Transcript_14786/g.30486 Transcript_14786/m.30486 type:complete len:117 (+) Transcript_14786:1875-2225(+)
MRSNPRYTVRLRAFSLSQAISLFFDEESEQRTSNGSRIRYLMKQSSFMTILATTHELPASLYNKQTSSSACAFAAITTFYIPIFAPHDLAICIPTVNVLFTFRFVPQKHTRQSHAI